MNLKDMEVTDTQLADLAGCSARYVRKLATDGHIKRVGRNTFVLGTALQGVIGQMNSGGGSNQKLLAERIRKLKADADLAELNLARERGDIAPIQEFERAQGRMYSAIQANILNVPSRAVLQLLGCGDEAVFKATLRSELVLALQQSAQADIELDDSDDESAEKFYDHEGTIE